MGVLMYPNELVPAMQVRFATVQFAKPIIPEKKPLAVPPKIEPVAEAQQLANGTYGIQLR
jgi:hypothetical protein